MTKWCHADSLVGIRARQYCPQTCGCDTPTSRLLLTTLKYGCSPTCKDLKPYRAAVDNFACSDVAKNSPEMTYFKKDLLEVSKAWSASYQAGISEGMFLLDAHGCAAVPLLVSFAEALGQRSFDFCQEGGSLYNSMPIKPLSYICPVACRCQGGNPHCPTSCPKELPNPDIEVSSCKHAVSEGR